MSGVRYSKILRILNILVILILVTIIPMLGCDDPGYKVHGNDLGNRTITVKKGIGHFTMIYPPDYLLNLLHVDNSGGISRLFVEFQSSDTQDAYSSINIGVRDMGGVPEAESWVKSALSIVRNYRNFKLIDESTLTVEGMLAYQYSYYYDLNPTDPHIIIKTEETSYVTILVRSVVFDHSGFLWEIYLDSEPSREEQDMATFDLVLDTFKVLD
ncbi:hypothetical protein ACFLXD_01065 [Chloroflexota bacterium]